MRHLALLACLLPCAAFAQERDVERALLQRQQQSEEFALQLRQSQERLQLTPGDLNQLQYLDSRHSSERQRLENLGAQQQSAIGLGLERHAADRNRRAELLPRFELRLPPPQARAPVTPRPSGPERYFRGYD